jgi:hypothetical protein
VWLLAVILVALPVSYENLAIIFGPIIAKIMLQVTGEIMFLQVGFAVMGLAACAIVAVGQWLYERPPGLAVCVGLALLLTAAIFQAIGG